MRRDGGVKHRLEICPLDPRASTDETFGRPPARPRRPRRFDVVRRRPDPTDDLLQRARVWSPRRQLARLDDRVVRLTRSAGGHATPRGHLDRRTGGPDAAIRGVFPRFLRPDARPPPSSRAARARRRVRSHRRVDLDASKGLSGADRHLAPLRRHQHPLAARRGVFLPCPSDRARHLRAIRRRLPDRAPLRRTGHGARAVQHLLLSWLCLGIWPITLLVSLFNDGILLWDEATDTRAIRVERGGS